MNTSKLKADLDQMLADGWDAKNALYQLALQADEYKAARDPSESFVVSAITREGIAEDLNAVLDRTEFAPDDVRLTKAVCEEFAAGLGNVSGENADDEAMQAEEFIWAFLAVHFGIE